MTNKTNINTEGDNIQVGDISSATGIAIGQGASAQVSIENYHEAPKQITFPLHQLPPANPNFTGRLALLKTIQTSFQNQQSSIAITQAIAGLGGVGKTQLALAYANAHRHTYDIISWLNAESEPALTESLISLGRALGLPVDTMDRPAAINALLTWITSTDKQWLLIYDNVDKLEPRELHPYLPGGRGHSLITSRNPHWRGTAQVLNVNVFTPKEAVDFLETRQGQADAENEVLAEELGYLPLALEHAAAYMEARDKTAGEYLRLFKAQRQALLKRAQAPDAYHATITTTWEIAFEHARQTPGAAELLNLCCFLAPDDIPLAEIQEQAAVLPEELAAVVTDELALDDARDALTRYSLLTKQDGALAIHRLVQAVARDQMGKERGAEWAENAVQLANALWPFDPNNRDTWINCSQLLPHLQMAADLADQYQLVTKEAATLNGHIDFYIGYFGDLKGAKLYSERALAIREKALGPEHPDTARSLNNLGGLHRAMGNLGEARPYYERALAIREKALGPEHPDTAQSLNNLGGLLQAMGNLGEARPYYERALAIYEKALGPEHPDTARSLNNLGGLLQAMGNLGEARPYFERALAIREKALGPEHPDLAYSLNNLGMLAQAEGDLLAAKEYLQRALSIFETALGSNHPNTAVVRDNLASVESELKS